MFWRRTEAEFRENKPWLNDIRDIFGLLDPCHVAGATQPVSILTLASGSDAPVEAAEQLLTQRFVRHIGSCDNAPPSDTFIHEKFSPEQWWGGLDEFEAWAKEFDAKALKIDVIVAGPPCKGHAISNPKRFKTGKGGFHQKDSDLFFQVISVIKAIRPKVAILEQVKGCLATSRESAANALEGAGINIMEVELDGIPWARWARLVLDSSAYLPQVRERVWHLLLDADIFSKADMDDIVKNVESLFVQPSRCPRRTAGQVPEPSAFALPLEHPTVQAALARLAPTKERFKKLHHAMEPACERRHATLRAFLGLPLRSDEKLRRRKGVMAVAPISSRLQPVVFDALCARERDLLDVVELVQHIPDKQFRRLREKMLVVPNQGKLTPGLRQPLKDWKADCSQSLERWPWSFDSMRTVQTRTKVFDKKLMRPYVSIDLFEMFGWRSRRLKIGGLDEPRLLTLVGNSMEVPVPCALLGGVLRILRPEFCKC